jgi:hypothetical protein
MADKISIMEAFRIMTESIKVWTESMLPKYATISLPAANWIGDASPYYQDVELSCVTESSIVNIQPDQLQLAAWQDECFAFTTLSSNGSVRVYVSGGLPTEDYTVQVTVQKVVDAESAGMYSNAIGSFGMPKSFVLVDENNNEYIGVVVGEEVVFTATAADIVEGKTAGTSEGVVVGTHTCD